MFVPEAFANTFDEVIALALPVLGASSEGRPLFAGPLGAGPGRPLLVVAGVHGNEPSSVEAVIELAATLRARPPTARAVWLLPALNPDGLFAGRKNSARDVDLNRNFPARNFSAEHKPGYFPGPGPLSEPETRVLAGLLARLEWAGVVAVHAPLACINYDGPAAGWAGAMAAASGWPVQADIGYPTPGSLGSWLGRDRGLAIVTLELPAGPYAEFSVKAQAALQTAIHAEKIG